VQILCSSGSGTPEATWHTNEVATQQRRCKDNTKHASQYAKTHWISK